MNITVKLIPRAASFTPNFGALVQPAVQAQPQPQPMLTQGSMLRRFALPLLAVRPRSPALRMLSSRVTMPPGCHFNTPLLESAPLSELMGTTVLLKMDALQPSGSFKDRGMAYLCAELKQKGATSLISSSGGNAGHAVAVVGRKLGMRVRVIVPETTKPIMLTKIRAQGAEVTVHGANWNEADELARELVAADSAAEYVSPYDDPLLWRGHSSIIDELAEAGVRPGGIVASVGGGGLLCGLIEGLERHGWQDTTLITAETEGASCFAAAMLTLTLILNLSLTLILVPTLTLTLTLTSTLTRCELLRRRHGGKEARAPLRHHLGRHQPRRPADRGRRLRARQPPPHAPQAGHRRRGGRRVC